MLINFRTLITLLSAGILEWLTANGIVEFDSATIESAVKTFLLVLAAIFRIYAGRKIFGRKTATPTPTE